MGTRRPMKVRSQEPGHIRFTADDSIFTFPGRSAGVTAATAPLRWGHSIDAPSKKFDRRFDFTESPGYPMRLYISFKALERMMSA